MKNYLQRFGLILIAILVTLFIYGIIMSPVFLMISFNQPFFLLLYIIGIPAIVAVFGD